MIVETPTLESYFYELVTASVELLDSEISPQAQYYLVTLLNGFVERQNALGVDNDCLDEPLALMLKRSLEASGESQARHLKQLGDVALFVSGFYSDRIDRKRVDMDYYIHMGGSAYARLAHLFSRRSSKNACWPLFNEMSDGFKSMVQVLSEVSESHSYDRDQDLLKLYEKWQKTRSMRLSQKLQTQGIIPLGASTTKS